MSESPPADVEPPGFRPSDGLAALGIAGFIGSVALPWLTAPTDLIILGDRSVSTMRGWQAVDVQLMAGVVILCAIALVAVRVTGTDDRLAAGPLAVAAIVVVGQASLYLLDDLVGLTTVAIHNPDVSAGIGVYLALLAGLVMGVGSAAYAIDTGLSCQSADDGNSR